MTPLFPIVELSWFGLAIEFGHFNFDCFSGGCAILAANHLVEELGGEIEVLTLVAPRFP